MSKEIEYIVGDATDPKGTGLNVIVHCCNDKGGWGRGFVVALSKRSRDPELAYRQWYNKGFYTSDKAGKVPFELGKVQFAKFVGKVIVCNLIGQHDMKPGMDGSPPIRYESINDGFKMMRDLLKGMSPSIHMPRMGCGLAGGEWKKMEIIIKETLCDHSIPVTVYDFPEK